MCATRILKILRLKIHKILIAHPGWHRPRSCRVSFSRLRPIRQSQGVYSSLLNPIEEWKEWKSLTEQLSRKKCIPSPIFRDSEWTRELSCTEFSVKTKILTSKKTVITMSSLQRTHASLPRSRCCNHNVRIITLSRFNCWVSKIPFRSRSSRFPNVSDVSELTGFTLLGARLLRATKSS